MTRRHHRVQFVTVEDGVRLEVLDWGGVGPNMVLLAGSGNTAHVYDDFAPKLTSLGPVRIVELVAFIRIDEKSIQRVLREMRAFMVALPSSS